MLRRTLLVAFVFTVMLGPVCAEERGFDGKGLECAYRSSFYGDRRIDEKAQPLRYRQLRRALRYWIFEDGKVFSPRVQDGSASSISKGIGLSYNTKHSSIAWGSDKTNFHFSLNQGVDDYGERWWELILAGIQNSQLVIFKATCVVRASDEIIAVLQKEVNALRRE